MDQVRRSNDIRVDHTPRPRVVLIEKRAAKPDSGVGEKRADRLPFRRRIELVDTCFRSEISLNRLDLCTG
jgi:hypothetical protein